MTVKDLIAELQRRCDERPDLADAVVYIARDSEARPMYSDDIRLTEFICDSDEGEQLEGNFLEIVTWS